MATYIIRKGYDHTAEFLVQLPGYPKGFMKSSDMTEGDEEFLVRTTDRGMADWYARQYEADVIEDD